MFLLNWKPALTIVLYADLVLSTGAGASGAAHDPERQR